jgi:hypothetical protein
MQERSKRICYLVSLFNRKRGYVTELCPTTWKRAGDVKVHMHGLSDLPESRCSAKQLYLSA